MQFDCRLRRASSGCSQRSKPMKRTILTAFFLTSCAWSQSFEVASIRPRADDSGIGLKVSGSLLIAKNNSLSNLITFAYSLKDYQVIGLPAWGDSERYDVNANSGDTAVLTRDSAKPMMQALLADRFQLKCHIETRDMPVYALVVAKNGPKFKESAPGTEAMLTSGGPRNLNVLKVTAGGMPQLADHLSFIREIGRPVLDKTGLTGVYDYTMRSVPQSDVSAEPGAESIFTAIQDQLGLKLEAIKASLQVLVVDHAEKPSGN
jgi:uncharacterized protein (TIGR03435 family)